MDEKDNFRPNPFGNQPRQPANSEGSGSGTEGPDDSPNPSENTSVVRLSKPITIAKERGKRVDPGVISSKFYNCFNYSLIPKGQVGVNLVVGITSPHSGDGKTLVASNLAVSLAAANQRETVLVDLCLHNPQIHNIFGTSLGPGLGGALTGTSIQLSLTSIEHLFVLPAGSVAAGSLLEDRIAFQDQKSGPGSSKSFAGLDTLVEFRNILYSLKREFEFVIVDMPSIQEPRVPLILTHQMDGLIVIVNANKTKHADIERLFNKVNENHILGFVLNRAPIT